MPPTEHQQICGRHGCNWKLENAALWCEAPLRELQEGIEEKKNQKREVGWLPELLTTVPGSLGGRWDSPVSHARHVLSPDLLASDVRGLHIQAVIQHQEICGGQERERESSCQNGAAGAGWGELSSVGKGFSPPQDGTAEQSWHWQLCFLLG